jgi:hypothetical protein
MKFGIALFARLGLFVRKEPAPDMFEQRLQRSTTREQRREVQSTLFRN